MSFYRSEYLKSDHWKTKRTEILLKRGQKCELCGAKSKLDIHHLTYKKLFAEPLSHMRVLCRTCHDAVHKLLKKYPKLKKEHPAKQWFIVWSHIRKTKPPASPSLKMNKFLICRQVLTAMKLVKHARMPWRDELFHARVRYSVPLIALAQYVNITGIDPRYRADRIGAQKLLTFPDGIPVIRKAKHRLRNESYKAKKRRLSILVQSKRAACQPCVS